MSGSWVSSAAGRSQVSQAAGPSGSALTVTCPAGQYQAGMRWPHHSWRDTFQSRMLVNQCSHTFSKRSGRIAVRPERVASRAASASGRGAHEPLGLQAGLHDVVAALAAPDDHLVGLLALEVAAPGQVGQDPRPRLVPVEAVVGRAGVRDARGVVEDRRHRQVVAPAGLVVVVVVRRA